MTKVKSGIIRRCVYKISMFVVPVLSGPLVAGQGYTKWVAPEESINLKNPVEGNTEALADAKKLYTIMCTPCHGYKGRGDGPVATAINPHPADHSSVAIQRESDGSLFYKITNGRGPMQSYQTQLTDAQRWALVNYIRTLKQ